MCESILKEADAGDLPDGLNAVEGVEYLARRAGWSGEGDNLPKVCIFGEELGFSEITGFIKSSDGRGYYQTTLTACTCKSKLYRPAVVCKHQKALGEALSKRGDRLPAHVELAIRRPEQLPYPVRPGARWKPPTMTSDDLETRRARIAARNAERREEAAKAPTLSRSKGFNLPAAVEG